MRSHKLFASVLLVLLLPSCATVNLARWGWGASSTIDEPHGDVSAAILKPGATVIGPGARGGGHRCHNVAPIA